MSDHKFSYSHMLEWRGIDESMGDEPCKECGGSGVKVYSTTSTWRCGIGGATLTSDVCDRCWGSGKVNAPWTNLRRIKH